MLFFFWFNQTSGFSEVARVLLNGGARLQITDNLGETALASAAEKGVRFDFFEYLFSLTGKLVCLISSICFFFSGNVDVVTVIIEFINSRKARKIGETLTLDPIDGLKHTPVYFAALNGHVHCVTHLINNGATVDYPDSIGWTPLMHAASRGITLILEENDV